MVVGVEIEFVLGDIGEIQFCYDECVLIEDWFVQDVIQWRNYV